MAKLSLSWAALDPLLNKIEPLSRLYRIVIVVLILALMVGGFTFFSYQPKYTKIQTLEKKLVTMTRQLQNAQIQTRSHKRFAEALKQAQAQFKEARQALPETKEIPSLLEAISASGQSSGLEFLLFRPAKEVQKDFFAEIPVEIRVAGDYHSVGLFFDKVAHLPRIVNIKDITIKAPKEGNRLETSCMAVTYRFAEAPPPKPAAANPAGRKRPKKK